MRAYPTLRLLGPNCIGLVNVTGHVALSANAVLERKELKPGHLSVISQSGSTLGMLISRAQARGLGERFEITNVYFKPYGMRPHLSGPAGRGGETHA